MSNFTSNVPNQIKYLPSSAINNNGGGGGGIGKTVFRGDERRYFLLRLFLSDCRGGRKEGDAMTGSAEKSSPQTIHNHHVLSNTLFGNCGEKSWIGQSGFNHDVDLGRCLITEMISRMNLRQETCTS